MQHIVLKAALAASVTIAGLGAQPTIAKEAEVALATCAASLGTIAIVDGDTQGWTKFGLGSPRELIAAMAAQSGCFTLHNPASGQPADFLMNAIAGDKEEVNQGVNIAKTAVIEGALRTGALGHVAGRVPVVGGMLGMFGGLGGKKKTVAAGLRVIDPATGQTIVGGSGEAKKSSLTFGGWGNAQALSGSGYATSKDGKMLSAAFIKAFNGVVSQSSALSAVKLARTPRPAMVQPVAATN